MDISRNCIMMSFWGLVTSHCYFSVSEGFSTFLCRKAILSEQPSCLLSEVSNILVWKKGSKSWNYKNTKEYLIFNHFFQNLCFISRTWQVWSINDIINTTLIYTVFFFPGFQTEFLSINCLAFDILGGQRRESALLSLHNRWWNSGKPTELSINNGATIYTKTTSVPWISPNALTSPQGSI